MIFSSAKNIASFSIWMIKASFLDPKIITARERVRVRIRIGVRIGVRIMVSILL
jgi:hypothetical protein